MKRILIADDEPAITGALKSILQRRAFHVSVAEDGEEACRKIEDENPDLVVLDLLMPKMSGEQVLKSMRLNLKTSETPVIISTARRDIPTFANLMSMGATNYLMKPYNIRELTSLIESYI